MPSKVLSKLGCDQIIDMMPGPFVVIDRQYQIIATNSAYRKQYGVEQGDVVGQRCHKISHHSDVPCSQNGERCPLEEVFATRQPTQVVRIHYDKHGKKEHVQLHAAPILDEQGEVMFMGEQMQVITPAHEQAVTLVGQSPPMLRMLSLLQRVAPTNTTTLLLGESGSGKERVADYLHHYSIRSSLPFVVVDCGTPGENLIESELFGHEKGAFTGALSKKTGLFEAASGGTLFIEEIGDLPLALQTTLLRVLETGKIRRIGGNAYVPVDVRVISATNRDIQAMVAAGRFRQDFYYRLFAFPIYVPPLRERKDDIARLAEHFLTGMPEGQRHIPLSSEVIESLLAYDYPGNVRELRNVIERAVILAHEDILRPDHIILDSQDSGPIKVPKLNYRLHTRIRRVTDEQIEEALQQSEGHRREAALSLGISERTLYRHLTRMRLV